MTLLLGAIATGFWFLMLYDCVQQGKQSQWLWLLIFLNFPGALLYFITQKLPYLNLNLPGQQWWNRRKLNEQLWNAKANARNINNAHQHVVLGELYLNLGEYNKARTTFQTALEKEPENPHALWGTAQLDVRDKQYETARDRLQTLLDKEPDFLRGDASLAYAQVLAKLEDWEAARNFWPEDLKKWGHPSVCLMLAELYIRDSKQTEARDLLEGMVGRVRGSYKFYYRQHKRSVRKAEKLLKSLA